MKHLTKLAFVAIALTGFIACNNTKSENEQTTNTEVATSEVLIKDGTFEGFSGDNYLIVAVNSGKYAIYNQNLGNATSEVVTGNYTAVRDSAHLDNGMLMVAKEATILLDGATLNKTSDATELDAMFTNTVIKEDESGNETIVKMFTENGQSLAKFEFKGSEYLLTRNAGNNDAIEYAANNHSLKLPKVGGEPAATFFDGSTTYNFHLLTPVTEVFKATDANAAVKELNVTYYTYGDAPVVILMSKEIPTKQVLTITEGANDSATYGNENTEWYITRNGATLTYNGSKIKFVRK